jgi:hypothetical protein
MVEFTVTAMRHYCRNPRCRSKLPTPVSNPREAFCTKGCRERFYRLRCYVCDEKKPGRLDAHTCGRRKCKNAMRTLKSPSATGRVDRMQAVEMIEEAGFSTAEASNADEAERIEAKNRAALKAAEQAEIEASGYFTEAGWREVVSPDGVLCFVIRFAPSQKRGMLKSSGMGGSKSCRARMAGDFRDRRSRNSGPCHQCWPLASKCRCESLPTPLD